jgi:hypothetical protein
MFWLSDDKKCVFFIKIIFLNNIEHYELIKVNYRDRGRFVIFTDGIL